MVDRYHATPFKDAAIFALGTSDCTMNMLQISFTIRSPMEKTSSLTMARGMQIKVRTR